MDLRISGYSPTSSSAFGPTVNNIVSDHQYPMCVFPKDSLSSVGGIARTRSSDSTACCF